MPWKIKTYVLVPQEEECLYQDWAAAQEEAAHLMALQPGEVVALVVPCDARGVELEEEPADWAPEPSGPEGF